MATAWPKVATALVALLPTLPRFTGVAVYDGPPVGSETPYDYVTVGYVEDEDAGSYETEHGLVDGYLTESGEVRCHFVSQSGDEVLPRAEVFALIDAVEVALRSDPTLGGVLSDDATCLLSGVVSSVQNANGSAQSVVVAVVYTTRR